MIREMLKKLGYEFEGTETVQIDNLRHKARYNAVAIKVKDGRVFMAQHLGNSADDAESKLVNMLRRK
jgi:hypothetical protein